ncbi:MAG: septum formation initiator family protein [Clostridiales bacterium]|nr:septum formation initiator family protein [Clostridiales bacterium]
MSGSVKKKLKIKRKSGGFSLPMTLICIAFVVVVVLCATKYYDVRMARIRLEKEKAALEAQKAALEDRNNNILARGVAGRDADYVEDVARSQLDMVYPGEIIFRTTGN